VGLVWAAAWGAKALAAAARPGMKAGLAAGGAAVVLALAVASTFQLRTWREAVAMWENCVRIDPTGVIANSALADNLTKRSEFDRALEHYERALRAAPHAPRILSGLALLLAARPEQELRDCERAASLAAEAFAQNPKDLRAYLLVRTQLARALARRGDFDRAIRECNAVLDLHPAYVPAMLQLALLLATCPQESLRDPDRAVALAERACESGKEPSPEALSVLAAAYAATGRFEEAVAAIDRATSRSPSPAGDTITAELKRQRAAYHSRTPCHDSAARLLEKSLDRLTPWASADPRAGGTGQPSR